MIRAGIVVEQGNDSALRVMEQDPAGPNQGRREMVGNDTSKRMKGVQRRLGDRLLADRLITEEQLKIGLERQSENGSFIGETLVALGYVKSADVGRYLSEATGYPFVELSEAKPDLDVGRLVDEAFARRKALIPFARSGKAIRVAMADPLDLSAIDALRSTLKTPVEPYLAFRSDVESTINQAFDLRHKAGAVLEEIADQDYATELSVDELVGLAEGAPIVRVVNSVIQGGIQQEASDIHIEPHENSVQVRYRLDGVLYDQMTIPKQHHAACISRLKIMSRMNIAERRRPQDGRFSVKQPGGSMYDVRVSVMPTVYGEKAVMRLLEKTRDLTTLDRLGFFPEQRLEFESMVRRPYGIVLVTGPTGSGKSTTLHAALHLIGNSRININTVEDPVEYNIPGANQVQVNPKIGVTFASALRTFLRQDPDVIMVGEIRDYETAEIAIQAALTGHLVLSTLHTNDAPSALVRLQNMGVEPYLITSAVLGLVGQRLLRTVCPFCKERGELDEGTANALKIGEEEAKNVYFGKGCPKCANRGMKGRTAAYEVVTMNDELREAVLRRGSGSELMHIARNQGMVTIQESGVKKVLEGITSADEVLRVLFVED